MSEAREHYQDWLGNSHSCRGSIDLEHTRAIAATLDRNPDAMQANSPLPPLWHWCFLHEPVAQSRLALDGHPKRGDFLPPIELPRRMWAGSRVKFHKPILIGIETDKVSTIEAITHKQGKSGELYFVTVKHRIQQGPSLCLTEEQDIVYRALDTGNRQQSPAPDRTPIPVAEFCKPMTAEPTLLFRYSAVTFNSHRIHYDRDYATGQENYPGLLVHGPLLATLLLELLASEIGNIDDLDEFTFRALSPVYDLTPFNLNGKSLEDGYGLWVSDESGHSCLQAEARLRA